MPTQEMIDWVKNYQLGQVSHDTSALAAYQVNQIQAAPEGERGFLDKLSESFKRGSRTALGDVAVYEAMENPDREDLTGALLARRKLRDQEALDPIEGRYLTGLAYKSANAAGMMFETVKRMGVAEAVGFAGGAAIGGVVSALDFIPGDEPIAVATGASVGAGIGRKVAGYGIGGQFQFKQSAGALYADMIEQGVDPATAKLAAKAGALPMAALGLVPLRFLGAPARRILTGKIQALAADKATNAIGRALSVYAKGLGGVVGIAELNNMIALATTNAAKSYQEDGIAFDQDFISNTSQDIMNTAGVVLKEAAEAGALLPVPGALLEGLVARAGVRVNNEINRAINKVDETTTVRASNVTEPEAQWHYAIREAYAEALSGREAGATKKIPESPTTPAPKPISRPAGITVYHGGPTSVTDTGGAYKGISTSTDKTIARRFIKGGEVGEYILPVGSRLLLLDKLPAELRSEYQVILDAFDQYQGTFSDKELAAKGMSYQKLADITSKEDVIHQKIVDYARSKDYDAVELGGSEKEIRIIKPGILIKSPPLGDITKSEQPITAERTPKLLKGERAAYDAYVKRTTAKGEEPKDFNSWSANYRVKRAKRKQEELRAEERKERLGKGVGKIVDESNAAYLTKDVEKYLASEGAYAAVGIDPLQTKLPVETFNILRDKWAASPELLPMEKYNLIKEVENIYYKGGIFHDYPRKLALKVMSPDTVDLLEAIGQINANAEYHPVSSFNDAARSLLAMGDISYGLRQNSFNIGKPSFFKTLYRGAKVFVMGEQDFKKLDADQRMSEKAQVAIKYGVRIRDIGGGYERGSEAFPSKSKTLQQIPLLQRSENAFIFQGNGQRIEQFWDIYQSKKGYATEVELKDLAHLVNLMNGEGDLPGWLKKHAHTVNAIAFAPRFAFSRVELATELFNPKLSGMARKYLAWNWARFVGVNAGILASMSMVPGVKVETDARSTDFGKMVIGDTHIDFWGGFLPLAHAVYRIASGQRKTAGGAIVDASMTDTISRFLQSKLGPVAGATLDFWRGETFIGENRDIHNVDDVSAEAYQRLVPFFIQDLVDAVSVQGLPGVGTGALAFLGASTSTYPKSKSTEVALHRSTLALEVFGQSWDELGPEGQKYLRSKFPEVTQLEAEAKYERDNNYFLETIEKNLVRSQKKMNAGMPKDVRDELASLRLRLSGVNRRIGTNWYLNNERYKQYEDAVLTDYQTILPKLVRSQVWQKLNPAGKAEILKKVTEELKDAERRRIVREATIKDINSLRRIRYGTEQR